MCTSGASATLRQIQQPHAGEVVKPRVQAGHLFIPHGQHTGRVRVITTLRMPPLAAARGSSFSLFGPTRRLDIKSASSAAYVAAIEQAQARAVSQLKAAIPSARVQEHYEILLDGFTVSVPVSKLPALRRLSYVHKIYPSLSYTQNLNRSPGVIGATQYSAATGDKGDGIKVGIVDDGIDASNRFFTPTGMKYPIGFPKGGLKWTTPKVIVARAYPGPGSGRAGRLPVDPKASFHATHVSGIVAGDENTTAPAGRDHPLTTGLSGVAPHAWLGNYRVFNAPSPIGNIANTPEIVKAFEDAVADGMDVINFSGGGPQTDPVNDAMYETVANVANAGVVPVISAGNDREDYGLGSAGSPGTVPEAISVAAVSNSQVFSPALTVSAAGAPAALARVPFLPAAGMEAPQSWLTADHTLVDIGTLTTAQGQPVDRKLCGAANDPSGFTTPLTGKPLAGAIALISRGDCSFVSKVGRARQAGAVGVVIVDNRSGEANGIPIPLEIPGGMISDADGAALRGYMATRGGRSTIRVGRSFEDIATGRSGIITSFSSAGPTGYEHALKPDVSAPGGAILSSTLPNSGGPFAVFDGTSMAAPHVSGAAALLLERHPTWSPQQVKSALMSTAGPAWGDTFRTQEASVLLEGAGLINVPAADDPKIFSNPASLSFGDVKPANGAVRKQMLFTVSDAGGGAGTWTVELHPQSASAGASLELPPVITVPPGGSATLALAATATAGAPTGDDTGFVILRQGAVARKIPYAFFVSTPQLPTIGSPSPMRELQRGQTKLGASRVEVYRWPGSPFGPPASYTGPSVDEGGVEHTYVMHIGEPVVNFGAAIEASEPGSLVDAWLLGSLDENDVQGYAGTPTNVNSFTLNYELNVGAAGAVFPRPKTYYFSIDSPTLPDIDRTVGGQYVLRSWINDVYPPKVTLVTKRVAAGRPTIVARVEDVEPRPHTMSGIDPTSLVLAYRGVLLGASAYDPASGIAVFSIPSNAPALPARDVPAITVAADYQESKNIVTPGGSILPNTTFKGMRLRVRKGPAVTWVFPTAGSCLRTEATLVVAASSTGKVSRVQFFDGPRPIATVTRSSAGLYAAGWILGKRVARGRHVLRAVVTGAGRQLAASRPVRICGK